MNKTKKTKKTQTDKAYKNLDFLNRNLEQVE